MPEISSFAIILFILWSLLYWLFGGIFFSIIAAFNIRRIHKVQFTCLFSISSIIAGAFAGWAGLQIAASDLRTCTNGYEQIHRIWIEQFACGILGIVVAGIIGFVLMMIAGYAVFKFSRNKGGLWIERSEEDIEIDE